MLGNLAGALLLSMGAFELGSAAVEELLWLSVFEPKEMPTATKITTANMEPMIKYIRFRVPVCSEESFFTEQHLIPQQKQAA
mmetsp:Transcript_22295/g.31079  ORF Transcript_22295/g.31079 Transcript_22295/m.31079 type:complete len:82 (-) Transcript_22295:863-1108(-)